MGVNPFDLGFVEEEAVPKVAAIKGVGIVYHSQVEQGSDAWLAMRCGTLTASEMKKVITASTLKAANNDDVRSHAFELAFQRLTRHVEPQYVSDAMLRGQEDEIYAREEYNKHFAKVKECGFVTSDRFGFTIGYSPDGLVGDDGLIEIKSRAGKYQVRTIADDAVPDEYRMQIQTALLVTGRKWLDFVSYCGGLPVFVKRVEPDLELHDAIVRAATAFEARVVEVMEKYHRTLSAMPKIIPTERREQQEIVI